MFHKNLKRIRSKKGLSREELAGHLQVACRTVSDWELDRSLPDAQLLMRLAQALDTSVEQLMGDALPPGCDEAAIARYLFAAKQQLMERNRRRRFYGRIRLGILSGLGVAVALLLLLWLVGLILS